MAHRIPNAGEALTLEDAEMILSAVATRRKNFPDEPPGFTIALVMLNIGDRFAPVKCMEEEWEGHKIDIPKGAGAPKCPNGHPITIQGPALQLGWITRTDLEPSEDE